MQLVVFGMLSYFFIPVLSGPLLFRVEVSIPQIEGRKEIEDITFINNKLKKFKNIEVQFATKAFDNEKIILVLDVQEYCDWPALTSALSDKGYKLSVLALQGCSDFAKQFNISVTYGAEYSDINDLPLLRGYDLVIDDTDGTYDTYQARIKHHLTLDAEFVNAGIKATCYRALGRLPVHLIYFASISDKEEEEVEDRVIREGGDILDFYWLLNIKKYKETC